MKVYKYLILLSIVFFAWAVKTFFEYAYMRNRGIQCKMKISEMIIYHNPKKDIYYPVVEINSCGKIIQLKSIVPAKCNEFNIGDDIEIIYDLYKSRFIIIGYRGNLSASFRHLLISAGCLAAFVILNILDGLNLDLGY